MIERGRHWIYIWPSEHQRDDGDGKWVFAGEKDECHALVPAIRRLVEARRILGAIVAQKDKRWDLFPQRPCTINFFTTADRYDMHRTKQILIKELKLKNLYWKSHCETEEDWAGDGALSLEAEITDCERRKEVARRAGRTSKVRGLEKWISGLRIRHEIALRNKQSSSIGRNIMIIRPVFGPAEYKIDPALCFVIMPFKEHFRGVYEEIKTVVESRGMRSLRADEIFTHGVVMDDIWKLINNAAIVIADITEQNANVFYELGISHTLGKKLILMWAEGGDDIPFDLRHWRHIKYRNTLGGRSDLRSKLGTSLDETKKRILDCV